MKMLGFGLILLAAISLFFSVSNGTLVRAESAKQHEARRITPSEVQNLLNKGEAILVDVRTEAAYRAGHIKGAWLIPASEIGSRIDELPRDKLIATYCA